MQFSLTDDEGEQWLKLPPVLDLSVAANFLDVLQQQLGVGHPLRLDASGVETLTLPCMQIVLAAMRSYPSVSIERESMAFVGAFEDIGVDWQRGELNAPDGTDERERDVIVELNDELNTNHNQTEELTMAKRIMTIDDSKTIRDMLMMTLSDAGFEVLQAVDGQDGVDRLGDEPVDVVITDINMPKMDGYEVIRRLRSNPVHRTTPILVLTTEGDAEKKNLAREAGATGWMVKPFDPDQLIATVNKVAP